jgi:hypothetical protein
MGSTLQIFSPIYDKVYFCRIHKKGKTPSFSVLTFRLFFSPWMVIYTLLKLHILLVFPNISYYHWVDFTDGRHVVHEDTIHLSAFKCNNSRRSATILALMNPSINMSEHDKNGQKRSNPAIWIYLVTVCL